jgi:hypothetical protein
MDVSRQAGNLRGVPELVHLRPRGGNMLVRERADSAKRPSGTQRKVSPLPVPGVSAERGTVGRGLRVRDISVEDQAARARDSQ